MVCLLSGGNNDVSRYAEVVERSLVHRGLKHYFLVEFPQEPGALRRFLDEVLGPDDDIVLFEYVKRDNRETGAALSGIEVGQPGRYGRCGSAWRPARCASSTSPPGARPTVPRLTRVRPFTWNRSDSAHRCGQLQLLAGLRLQYPHRLAGQQRSDVLDGLAVEDRVGVAGDVAQVRGEDRARRRPQRVVVRQRLLVEDVEPGAGDAAAVQRVEEGLLVDDGPRLVLTRIAVGFMRPRSSAPISPRVRLDSSGWTVTTSAWRTAPPPHPAGAHLRGPLVGEVLAPGDDVHAEGEPDAGDLAALTAEADDAEPRAGEVVPTVSCQPPARTEASSCGM